MNADFAKELRRLRRLAAGVGDANVAPDLTIADANGAVMDDGPASDADDPALSDSAMIGEKRTLREMRTAVEEFDVRLGMLENRRCKHGESRHWASRIIALEATARTLEAALAGMSRELLRAAEESVMNQNRAALLDRFAFEFEGRHGGKREEVVDGWACHVDLVADHDTVRSQGRDGCKVIDIGCGRGEWLEALRAAGFSSSVGVDSNEEMIRECQRRDLSAIRGNHRKYLQNLPDASVTVVTAFDVVERSGLATALALFKEARRVLEPGGLLLVSVGQTAATQAAQECGLRVPTSAVAYAGSFIAFALEFSGFAGIVVHGESEVPAGCDRPGRAAEVRVVSCRKP